MTFNLETIRRAPVTALICLWSIVTFFALRGDTPDYERWGYADAFSIHVGSLWVLLTSNLIHFNLIHLAFNLFWVWYLCIYFEPAIGSGRFLALFLWIGTAISLVELWGGQVGVGLSGFIYAVFGFMWAARDVHSDFKHLANRTNLWWLLAWGLLGIVLTATGKMSVGNLAHAAGFALGLASGAIYAKVQPWRGIGYIASGVLVSWGLIALSWNPASTPWLLSRSVFAFWDSDYARAEELANAGLKRAKQPHDQRQSLEMLAEIYKATGRQKEADAVLDRASRFSEGDSSSHPAP